MVRNSTYFLRRTNHHLDSRMELSFRLASLLLSCSSERRSCPADSSVHPSLCSPVSQLRPSLLPSPPLEWPSSFSSVSPESEANHPQKHTFCYFPADSPGPPAGLLSSAFHCLSRKLPGGCSTVFFLYSALPGDRELAL